MTRQLVLSRSHWKTVPTDMRVGWRVTTADGRPYDVMWGACRDEDALHRLLAELRAEHGAIEIVDLRGVEDGLRDSAWYSTAGAAK
jgi:hypothetical protein